MDPRELLLSQLGLIDGLARATARRQGLSTDEAADFAGYVRLRMVANDYAILARFSGRSLLRTYLITVVQRLFVDYAAEHWGRFRPSARARREGPEAVVLEIAMVRDGLEFPAAFEVVRRRFGERVDRERLRRWSRPLEAVEAPARRAGGGAALGPEGEHLARLDEAALRRVFAAVTAEERLLLRLRFEEGMPVREVAASLGLAPRPLFHRYDRLLARLRDAVRAEHLSWRDVRRLLDRGVDLEGLLGVPGRSAARSRESGA